jgi:hypothetical protein
MGESGGRVASRVREQVLEDPLHHRSVPHDRDGVHLHGGRAIVESVPLVHQLPSGHVELHRGGLSSEGDAPDPFHVGQVVREPRDLLSVGGDPPRQDAHLLRAPGPFMVKAEPTMM